MSAHCLNSGTDIADTCLSEEIHVIKSDNEKSTTSSASKFRFSPKIVMSKMANTLREVILMFLAIIVYASLTNSPPKVTKIPAAYPFFPRNSITLDFYRGHISNAIEYARESDVAFVMFYAPWDAESQEVREQFELTAKYLQNSVSFTAVNCWQPNGQCRKQYNKVFNWPVLIAYPTHGRGVQYYGPKTAPYMMQFLYNLMSPIIRIKSAAELNVLQSKYDAVIVTNVIANPGSYDYAVVYNTALRLLERYPFQEVIIAVNTVDWDDNYRPEMRMYLWNETLIYPEDYDWKTDMLVHWIQNSLHQVSMWLSPHGTKSNILLSYIQSQPALVLFTPRNPLARNTDYYYMLRQIALQYYDCGALNGLSSQLVHSYRMDEYRSHKNSLKRCLARAQEMQSNFKGSVTLSTAKIWDNQTNCKLNVEKCGDITETCSEFCTMNKFSEPCVSPPSKISMFTGDNDLRSPENLKKLLLSTECTRLSHALKFEPSVFSETLFKSPVNGVDIKGLSCRNNNTLNIIAMDSLIYHEFAIRLGIDIAKMPKKTALVIINDKAESHHVLNGKFTEKNIEQFIYNFSQNHLQRAVISTKPNQDSCETGHVCLQELNSGNFLDVTQEPNKAVVVLYYSKQCAFCSGISHLFLGASRLFTHSRTLRFVRIDGELNTLPWEFTMEQFPTVLLFPAHGKAESRVFPASVPVSVTNLVRFIVENLETETKIEALWSLCVSAKLSTKESSCLSHVRLEILSATELKLREWRLSSPRLKRRVLRKLQNLKQLHLLLAYSPTDYTAIRNHFTLYTHR